MGFEFNPKPGSQGLLWAYWKISSARLTGLLCIEWDRYKKQILFRRGEPLSARSNWLSESFAQFLIKLGRFDNQIIQEELKKEGQKQLLGERLMGRGIISGPELLELLCQNFHERLFNLLTLTRGSLKFEELALDHPAFQEQATQLKDQFAKLLWAETKNLFTEAICRDKLSPYLTQEASVSAEFPLPLSPQDLRTWNNLKSRPLTIPSLDLLSLKLLTAATEFQLVNWKPKSTIEVNDALNLLEERSKKASPFAVLDLPDNATIEDCKKAFIELVRKHHPDRLPPTESAEVKRRAEAIFAKINEAYSIVTDPEKRKEFEAQQEFEKQGGMEAIQKRLEAEMQIPQAKMALKRRHFKQALDQFNQILTVMSEDVEILADRAFAEFMMLLESKADVKPKLQKLQKEIQDAIQKRNDYAPAYFYLGTIAKQELKMSQALQYFEKASEVDPRFNEAISEARLLRSRMEKKK